MSNESLETETQVHLLAVRKALANRNAAVMVGAGFSRNAEGGETLATWSQLSQTLAMELEANHSEFTPAAAAQLAEQYARVFSPTHLEQLIKRCIPDDQVSPNLLHTRLLELPWSDIFTTNYDTLLERAAERMFEVSYFTVCAREDIPQSKILGRRRIVKLHGSFPSHRPFILTEEDYRTYPERFAPFVNLVKQSLLENVFCLIGFSGDDPNFLHWLGWVRDMLDKHALPVYLFLAKKPTLGEQKLYEARGVTPIVLPTPENANSHNFYARYQELFNELSKPLIDSPLDWGGDLRPPQLSLEKQDDEAFSTFLAKLPLIGAYRRTYPGWIVAPKEVRQRIRSTADWLQERLLEKWLSERLAKCAPPLILAVIDLYFWVQHLILGPIIDDIAELGRQALIPPESKLTVIGPDIKKVLDSMLITDTEDLRRTHAHVGVALLTWARQSHHTEAYIEIKQFLQSFADEDSAVYDSLVHQEILHCLQRADRQAAFQHLGTWRPKSSDAYVHVRRAALMAELKDTAAAIPIIERAIQTLRRQQRSRPNDPALISREAWACLVARHMQDAEDFYLKLRNPSLKEDEKETTNEDLQEREDFDGRLNVLVARGYSAREELNAFVAKLNAEAQPPVTNMQRLECFDLGTTSTHTRFGFSADLTQKINASFAWLELFELVGLPLRTSNASFYTDQLLQAAWWSRFLDTPGRSIGMLLRVSQSNALKPRNRFDPPHRTGWLERQDVALLTVAAATEISAELIRQLIIELGGAKTAPGIGERAVFLLETFSRLAIRGTDQQLLMKWAEQLLRLHRTTTFQVEHSLWKPASVALKRVMEALSDDAQESVMLEIFRLPLSPLHTGNIPSKSVLMEWVNVQTISQHCSPWVEGETIAGWRDVVENLIRLLKMPYEEESTPQIWRRINVMRSLNILTDKDKTAVGDILWRNIAPGEWPTIPGFYPIGTLAWPAPGRNAPSLLLDRLLKQPLRPFSSGYMLLTLNRGGRSYSIGGVNETVGQIQYTVARAQLTLAQISKLLQRIENWLDEQQEHLIEDLLEDSQEDLHGDGLLDSVSDIVTHVDQMLETCVHNLSKRKRTMRVSELLCQVIALNERLKKFPIVRIRVELALISHGKNGLSTINRQLDILVHGLMSDNDKDSRRAFRAAVILLQDNDQRLLPVAGKIFDIIVACIFTQRSPCISLALDALASLSVTAWKRYLDSRTELLLDTALTYLEKNLHYGLLGSHHLERNDSLPLIRYRAMRLAHTLVHTAMSRSQAARRWLESADVDPLPEIRLGRYRPTDERRLRDGTGKSNVA